MQLTSRCTLFILTSGLFLIIQFNSTARAQPAATATLSLYGNFNTLGVMAVIPADADPDRSTTATLFYRLRGETVYRRAFPLSRVSDQHFIGSLFWLKPGLTYEVRVTFQGRTNDILNGLLVGQRGVTRREQVLPQRLFDIFVSNAGSDSSGNGSFAKPFRTISRALQNATSAGTHVILRGGVYREGQITIASTGTATHPFAIVGFPGEQAILDGSEPSDYTWEDEDNGLFSTTIETTNTHLVCAGGMRLYPYGTLNELRSLSWGLPGFFLTDTTLYVHLLNDADPTTTEILVSRFNHGFRVNNRNHIQFRDLTFRYYGRLFPSLRGANAIRIESADDIVVSNCKFITNDMGVYITGNTDRLLIEENEFSDTIFEWPYEALLEDSELEGGGARVFSPYTGQGLVIRRNTFHDLFDGLGVVPFSGGPFNLAGIPNETDVHDNQIFRCAGDGIEIDGQSANIRVWGNTIHDALSGVSLAPAITGPVYCIRNIIYGEPVEGGSGDPFKIGNFSNGSLFFFHNSTAMWKGLYLNIGDWDLVQTRNNIFFGTQAYAFANKNTLTTPPLNIDYDVMWERTSDFGLWMDTVIPTFDALQTTYGLELHGRYEDPLFIDRQGGDFNLPPFSDLLDSALVIPGINDLGFSGSGPDFGAIERNTDLTKVRRWRIYK